MKGKKIFLLLLIWLLFGSTRHTHNSRHIDNTRLRDNTVKSLYRNSS